MEEDKETGGEHSSGEKYRLPNGMSVYHLNPYETDFTYREIFVEQIYLKHGIRLAAGACIFDIGANIGLFSLFAKRLRPDARVFAFEPSPELYDLLCLNLEEFDSSVRVFQCGISDQDGTSLFSYYPRYSILSGFHTDAKEDAQSLFAGANNQARTPVRKDDEIYDRYFELLVSDKLDEVRQIECPLRTISSVIKEAEIGRIHLLKIDAEKSEMGILNGIDQSDWPKIDQIVMESHSRKLSDSICSILNAKGFKVSTEQENRFDDSEIVNIFAIRSD